MAHGRKACASRGKMLVANHCQAGPIGLSSIAYRYGVPWAFWGLVALVVGIALGTYVSLARPLARMQRAPEVLEATAA